MRGIRGVTDDDARRRIGPMNSISWNVGHLAWQEQQYFVTWPSGARPFPEIDREFVSGGPPSTPPLERVVDAWRAITAAADPWLDTLTRDDLEHHVVSGGTELKRRYGDLLQRVVYHYWFHTGENAAIRQQLVMRDFRSSSEHRRKGAVSAGSVRGQRELASSQHAQISFDVLPAEFGTPRE